MKSVNILLIEHDAAVQTMLVEVLTHAGYHVCAATHDADVGSLMHHCHPTIALISDGSRGLFASGWRAAEEVHRVDPALPLVLLSTNTLVVDEVGHTARGRRFVAGVQKPFDLDTLLTIIAQHCAEPAYTDV